jgi:outer membrane receptor protein involved in Fe transport
MNARLWLCIALLSSLPAAAQVTTATYYGTVVDPSGSRIPGANVSFVHNETGAVTTKSADSGGEFSFDFLRVGTYTIRIEAAGFKTFAATDVELAAAQTVRQTFTLTVGSVRETVSVESHAPLVNSVNAEQRESMSSAQVSGLPLARRNYTNLLSLGTGVTVSNSGGGPGHSNRDGGVRLNGLGRSGTTFTVDGTDANANSEGRAGALFTNFNYIDMISIEAVQEVQVVKGIIPAEYSSALSGNVNLITKSGTNSFHGSLFENFQSRSLNARNQFLTSKAPLTYNQFGGSAGGALIRDRVFLFGTYEGYQEVSSPLVSGNSPTPRLRDEMIRANPAFKQALDTIPLPNQAYAPTADVGFFQDSRTARAHDNHLVAKGDIRIDQFSNLALTWTHGRPFRDEPMYYIGNNTVFHGFQERGTASYVTGRAAWTSETRFGYNLQELETFDGFLAQKAPGTELSQYGRRIPAISSSLGFTTASSQIWSQYGPSWTLDEKFSLNRGKHSFKFGANYIHRTGGRVKVANPVISYVGRADMIADIPSTINVTFGPNFYNGNSYDWGVFAQDDWKVTPRLVVNLGLRYDFFSHVIATPLNPDAPAQFNNLDGLLDNQFHFGPFRDPNNPYESDGGVNMGPRVGFSYNPDGNSKTVIRGGFGILFSPQMQGLTKQSVATKTVPFRTILSKQEAAAANFHFPTFNDDARAVVESQAIRTGRINVFAAFDPHFQNPYSMNLYLGLQRELNSTLVLESAFVGNRGVKFPLQRVFNAVDRITGLRPNPLLNDGYYIDNTQNTVYASWQNSLRKRYSRNLVGAVHYTWAKGLSTAGGDIGAYFQGDQDIRTQDFFNPRADRGPSSGDITHYLSVDSVYDLPQFTSVHNRFVRQTIGGWQLTGIFRANTGEPLLITQGSSLQGSRPDYVGGTVVNSDYRSSLVYLNRSAVAPVPIVAASAATLRPGTMGNGAVRGPGLWRVDFSIGKNFAVTERAQLQFRIDSFNATNHTNFAALATNINAANFGRLTSTRGSRIIQLNAHLRF